MTERKRTCPSWEEVEGDSRGCNPVHFEQTAPNSHSQLLLTSLDLTHSFTLSLILSLTHSLTLLATTFSVLQTMQRRLVVRWTALDRTMVVSDFRMR